MKTTSFITLMSLGLIVALSSFRSNSGTSPVPTPSKPKVEASTAKDVDVNALLSSWGIRTQVNEQELQAQYPGVSVAPVQGSGVEIKFANPAARQYRLDIYDLEGNVLVTYIDIFGDTVKVDNRFVAGNGSYLYKLSGEGNTYAGKFSAQLP